MAVKMKEKKYPNFIPTYVDGDWTTYKTGFYRMPFGYIEPNGLNFRNSVNNPSSRLYRMLRYIADRQRMLLPTTRNDILRDVFNVDSRARGWASIFFSLAKKCGFIRHQRQGNAVFYYLTAKGRSVIS